MPTAQSHDLRSFIEHTWDTSILPALCEYIRIPNKSPLFDPQWREHGHMQRAVALVEGWCRARPIEGLAVEVLHLPERTPLIFMEVAGSGARRDTVLLYGHLDKQPELGGWKEGLDPWQPVREGDRLYGRGSADDGYAAFASLTAIEALQRAGLPHARCVILIEAGEESGSPDLAAYLEQLAGRIGDVSLVVCGDYERLWNTTSLRGLVTGNLIVSVLNEGVHSGDGSGVVASSFRIARALLSRLESERTGKVKLRELHVKIPKNRLREATATARVLGRRVYSSLPLAARMKPVHSKPRELLLNRTFRPALSVTGAAGLPSLQDAGNVLRASTALKLSLRVPPTCDAARATRKVKATLERNPPYGATVRFEAEDPGPGWNAPPLPAWLAAALDRASLDCFGKKPCAIGEGGSIPFMGMLGEKFPKASFFITGVLGPHSNAHGPNEFLHVPTAKRLTECVSHIIAAHHTSVDETCPPKRRRR